jgi:hypothetical protein
VERLRLDRLTLVRYVSKRPRKIWFHTLRDLPTGFGSDAVVIDGLSAQVLVPPRAGLKAGALASVRSERLR